MKVIDWGGPICGCGKRGRQHLQYQIYQTATKWGVRTVDHRLWFDSYDGTWFRWHRYARPHMRRYFKTRELAETYVENQP